MNLTNERFPKKFLANDDNCISLNRAGQDEEFIPWLSFATSSLVNYTKSLGVPVICFPRGIKDYSQFCKIVKPSMVNIDYDVDPKNLLKNIDIPIQGGLHPEALLTNKENLKKEVNKYLDIFKDHPYVFNLGHGILPETKIEMVEELVKIVRDFIWRMSTLKLNLVKPEF